MPYRIAGIDVHKKKMAVVVADLEVEDEYQFERRWYGGNPEQLQLLAAWLIEQQVEEVVMESTAQYWKPLWAGAVLEANLRETGRSDPNVGNPTSGASLVQSWTARAQERFSRRQHQDAVERLAEVPGLGVDSAQQIIAEVGAKAATLASAKALSSWVGACPGDEESAGVNRSKRSPKAA